MNCLHCGATVTNGLAWCELCQRKAADCLESLPVYFRNLARWQPGRAGTRDVPGSQEPRLPGKAADDRVSRALDEAGNAVMTWARQLEDDRGIVAPSADGEVEQVEALCRWLAEHLTSIATLDWCGDFIRRKRYEEDTCTSIGYHDYRLRLLTAEAIPGWYAGECRHCGTSTYVVPGLIWSTCPGCGTTTFARDHLDVILDEARDWIARPMRMAEAIVALVDTELSVPRLHKRISKWGERGNIPALRDLDADGDEVGPKKFRLGDVLNMLVTEGATRLNDSADAAAC